MIRFALVVIGIQIGISLAVLMGVTIMQFVQTLKEEKDV